MRMHTIRVYGSCQADYAGGPTPPQAKHSPNSPFKPPCPSPVPAQPQIPRGVTVPVARLLPNSWRDRPGRTPSPQFVA